MPAIQELTMPRKLIHTEVAECPMARTLGLNHCPAHFSLSLPGGMIGSEPPEKMREIPCDHGTVRALVVNRHDGHRAALIELDLWFTPESVTMTLEAAEHLMATLGAAIRHAQADYARITLLAPKEPAKC